MTTAIKWQTNNFISFEATVPIKIGASDPAVSIPEGASFLFDGTTVRFNGSEYSAYGLRSAYLNNWFHLSDEDAVPAPVNATFDRPVALAKSGTLDMSHGAVPVKRKNKIDVIEAETDTIMRVKERTSEATSKTSSLNIETNNSKPKVVTARSLQNERSDRFPVSASLPEDGGYTTTIKKVQDSRVKTLDPSPVPVTSSATDEKLDQVINIIANLADEFRSVKSRLSHVEAQTKDRTDRFWGEEEQGSDRSFDSTTKEVDEYFLDEGPMPTREKKPSSRAKKEIAEEKATSPARATRDAHPDDVKGTVPSKITIAATIMPGFPEDYSFTAKVEDRINFFNSHLKKLPKSKRAEFMAAVYAVEDKKFKKQVSGTFSNLFSV